jgi:hypothetical protein
MQVDRTKGVELMRALLTLGLAAAAAACTHDVEVKLDTPTASVATAIKFYAADDKGGRVEQVVDPLFMSLEARRTACLDEAARSIRCTTEFTRGLANGSLWFGGGSAECEDPPSYEDCTCGEKGSAAVKKGGTFVGSSFDQGLALAHLSPETCKITASTELEKESLHNLVADLPALVCSKDVASAKMTAVTFVCGDASMTAILRKNKPGWQIIAFADKTAQLLRVNALGASLEQSAKKRESDLNKDLR